MNLFVVISRKTLWPGKFETILTGITNRVMFASKALYPNLSPPSDQSLRNLRGSWFETAISVISWNTVAEFNQNNRPKVALLRLPSVGVIRWWDIFDGTAKEALDKGLFKSLKNSGIEMTLPNPDLVCVRGIDDNFAEMLNSKTLNPSLEFIRRAEKAYEFLIDRCNYNSLKFGLSVKHELKPDRRFLNSLLRKSRKSCHVTSPNEILGHNF